MTNSIAPAASKVKRTLQHFVVDGQHSVSITTYKSRTKAERIYYRIDKLASDFGDAFKLSKFSCDIKAGDGEASEYNVNLSDEGSTCECKGWLRHGNCKHVDSLIKLRELGKI